MEKTCKDTNDLLCPKRYCSIQYGVGEKTDGQLLLSKDIIRTLEYILDDDNKVKYRIKKLLDNLRRNNGY